MTGEVTSFAAPAAEFRRRPGSVEAIVSPQWQLIMNQNRPAELYHWSEDPHEFHNLASAEPDILQRLSLTLQNRTGEMPQQNANTAVAVRPLP